MMLLHNVVEMWSQVYKYPSHPINYRCNLCSLEHNPRVIVCLLRPWSSLPHLELFLHPQHLILFLFLLTLILLLRLLPNPIKLFLFINSCIFELTHYLGGLISQFYDLCHHLAKLIFISWQRLYS